MAAGLRLAEEAANHSLELQAPALLEEEERRRQWRAELWPVLRGKKKAEASAQPEVCLSFWFALRLGRAQGSGWTSDLASASFRLAIVHFSMGGIVGVADRAIEAAANRVFMAAKLFVHLLTQREASLQQRIRELLALADAADSFHKKTVTASVGGGVASVAGSITTITGLVLAPFTFGTSLIVTAVGIGVATAGGVTSASANITDTVHSNTDRKKVEKMIQDYQHEMKDIKECLDFLKHLTVETSQAPNM
ncbi:apolipo L6-like protein [Labeo rohita]|uniref:Apolipo L6-like protein n=1 Tax=Labeo rohita TaxID=84645 RepID=A0A498MGI0_LABRO|nr:apolipo L6-like protein [Labeo rohita]